MGLVSECASVADAEIAPHHNPYRVAVLGAFADFAVFVECVGSVVVHRGQGVCCARC